MGANIGSHANNNGMIDITTNSSSFTGPIATRTTQFTAEALYYLPGDTSAVCFPAKIASTAIKGWLLKKYGIHMKNVHALNREMFNRPNIHATRIAFFRHPVARYLSAYNNKIHCNNEYLVRNLFKELRAPYDCKISPLNLAKLLLHARKQNVYVKDVHFASQYNACNYDHIYYDKIILIETVRPQDLHFNHSLRPLLTELNRLPVPLLNMDLYHVLEQVYKEDFSIAKNRFEYDAYHAKQFTQYGIP